MDIAVVDIRFLLLLLLLLLLLRWRTTIRSVADVSFWFFSEDFDLNFDGVILAASFFLKCIGGVLIRSMDTMSTSLALSSWFFPPRQSMGMRLLCFFLFGDGDCGVGYVCVCVCICVGDVGDDCGVFPFLWPAARVTFFHLSRIPNMPAELPSFLLLLPLLLLLSLFFNLAMV